MAFGLNSSLRSIKSGSIQIAYTHADAKLALKAQLSMDMSVLVRDLPTIISQLPGAPEKLKILVESLLETTYASISSAELSATYSVTGKYALKGTIDFSLDITIEGNLSSELNYIKKEVFEYYASFLPLTQPIPWQTLFINETSVTDLSHLTASFHFMSTPTSQSTKLTFDNLKIKPPRNMINATAFRLTEFFNLTASPYEPPREGQKYKLTVEGGSNITHAVILSRPPTVPEPDETSPDMRTMVWGNQTISSLKDLTFNIKPIMTGVAATAMISSPETVTEVTPVVINASNAATMLNIIGISKPVTIVIRNETDPEGVEPPPGSFKLVGTYIEIITSENDIAVNATIRINYSLEELATLGIDENTLKIHYWNATLGEWVAVESHVNTEEHFVWANIHHLSLWALLGQPSIPIWAQPQFLAILVVVVAAIAIFTSVIILRKRKPPLTQPETSQLQRRSRNNL
jgi:hypothetical protein